ncbi:hypothetical protein [Thalassoglobus sp.]|uniref:hypothetical protein n=1 Tax=Thalassoglobus sp. TaxID=2795869 RepID=UPI003AA898DE
MNDLDDLVAALAPVTAAFQKLGIRHYVGGSVASSFHGAARSTMDVDVVAEMTEPMIPEFLSCFDNDFYLSEPAIRDAIRRSSCFNLIHLPTSFKVDVFVSRQRSFDQSVMDRATIESLGDSHSLEIHVATAEDTIILKLERYRKSNETSDRQSDDVTRLLKLLGNAADVEYLKESAHSVGVQDLLEQFLSEV